MSIPIIGQTPGLQGLKEGLAAHIKRSIRVLMVDALADQLLHAEIVAAGLVNFRQAFGKDMGAFFDGNRAQCDTLAEVVFNFLRGQWSQKYPDISPEFFLDKVEIVSPPSEAEIEDAWEVEIGSSESAMKQMYEGSARVRKGRDLGAKNTKPERTH